jgi:multisubunit Na+/H+ antiporter MnhG subunit
MRPQRLDALGLAISVVCMVHCLALPLIALLLPTLALRFDHTTDHQLHWLLLALAAPVSSLALWRGARRHQRWTWLKVGTAGLALMLLGVLHTFGEKSEVAVTMLGVSLLALAHFRNVVLLWQTHAASHSYPVQEGGLTMAGVELEDQS